MMDLHMHTIYSDGEITQDMVLELSKEIEEIAVTDHNSVGMALCLGKMAMHDKSIGDILKNFVVGAELTVEGYPDLLVYYPRISLQDIDALQELELQLQAIRINEELAVEEAYKSLGFCNWETDKKNAFPAYAQVFEARTRELASICYCKRTGHMCPGFFEPEDLRKARIARRGVVDGRMCVKHDPYTFSKNTLGELVLAHPIRTAMKRADRQADYNTVIKCLYALFDEFEKNGGKIIEWEYLDCEINQDFSRYPVLQNRIQDVREHIKKIIDSYSFQCVWGSDSHIHHPKEYMLWEKLLYAGLKNHLPYWVKL